MAHERIVAIQKPSQDQQERTCVPKNATREGRRTRSPRAESWDEPGGRIVAQLRRNGAMSRRRLSAYSRLSEWKDVAPKKQDDGPHGVVAIAYGKTHLELLGYLHAVLDSGEISARTFRLTGDILPYNYACYTVWKLRRQCLFELDMDVQHELDELEETTIENHKNYQVWWHRRECLQRSPREQKEKELEFLERVFALDPKNYHAWEHRQWVVRELGAWEREMDVTETMIRDDPRNNSAWSQRHWAANRGSTPNASDAPLATCESELEAEVLFTTSIVKLVPHSESPWNYLRGLLQIGWGKQTIRRQMKSKMIGLVRSFCEKTTAEVSDCRHCIALLADILAEPCFTSDPETSLSVAQQADIVRASELYRQLRGLDQIRANYWHLRESQVLTAWSHLPPEQAEAGVEDGRGRT